MKDTKFIFLGDAEPDNFKKPASYELWKALLITAWEETYPSDEEDSLLVLAGDLVRRSRKDDNWKDFFAAADPFIKKSAVIAAIGNHDCRDGIDYLYRLKTPENGPEGFERRFYSYDFGCCHFTVLDTNSLWYRPEYDNMKKYSRKFSIDLPPYDPVIAPVPLITEWMEKDFENSRGQVIFVLMHHPMFSAGTSEGDNERATFLQENFLPVMKKHGVSMILCGHQHLYCRTDLKKTGIIQLMGVSGNKLFDAWDRSSMEFVHEFTSVASIFNVSEKQISIKTIDSEKNVIDNKIIMLT